MHFVSKQSSLIAISVPLIDTACLPARTPFLPMSSTFRSRSRSASLSEFWFDVKVVPTPPMSPRQPATCVTITCTSLLQVERLTGTRLVRRGQEPSALVVPQATRIPRSIRPRSSNWKHWQIYFLSTLSGKRSFTLERKVPSMLWLAS
jgi:hypothetical protein